MYEHTPTLSRLREARVRDLAARPLGRPADEPRQGEHRTPAPVLEPAVSDVPCGPVHEPAAPDEPEAEESLIFADMLEGLLLGRRLSQSKAGRLCGFDHSYLSRLCTGTRLPSPEGVGHICRGLQLSPIERFRLYIAAGFLPPDMPPAWLTAGELMVAIEQGGGQ